MSACWSVHSDLRLLLFGVLFVFIKQKTAYEMRISDWSSDVCSSDLRADPATADLEHADLRARRQFPGGRRADVEVAVAILGRRRAHRSEERRVGKECVSKRRSRGSR